jgi:hypothetical protein
VNTYFEALIFSSTSATAIYAVVMYLPASLLCTASVAFLFPSNLHDGGFPAQFRAFFTGQNAIVTARRLLAGFLAFPLVYTIFGMLISPVVLPYYQQGSNQLALSGWDKILPVLALRSLFFLAVCFPVLMAWKLSDRRLVLTLGLTLFITVGGVAMLSAYWLPNILRETHSLEIFADEMLYAGTLVLIFRKGVFHAIFEKAHNPAQ